MAHWTTLAGQVVAALALHNAAAFLGLSHAARWLGGLSRLLEGMSIGLAFRYQSSAAMCSVRCVRGAFGVRRGG